MKVKLAGYNIDYELINRMKENGDSLTPEVLSASYARISRDPREISTLRKEARQQVEKARKSNENIVFGLGHSSVAEHAVFNFDIMGISRLAVEALESFRLASYTEKSQRYIKIGKDFIVPAEIREQGLAGRFNGLINYLEEQYNELYRKMSGRVDKSTAKEDARYLLPLATSAQLGMTVNARELEYMVSRLASHPLRELQELAEALTSRSSEIAPSLIKYPEASEYFTGSHTSRNRLNAMTESDPQLNDRVILVSAPGNSDELIAAAILFSSGGCGIEQAARKAEMMTGSEKSDLITETLINIQPHDSVWREFEFVNFIFQASVSASCFAQLKRHRMATIVAQPYIPDAPVRIPDSARENEKIFHTVSRRSAQLYRKIMDAAGREAAEYALLNAHRRRVLVGMNLRELYHFSRLRSDIHAQWEIRELSERICSLVREEAPMASVLLGGKDNFEELKEKLED
ncbi:MAG: FAD-dependent thymidylate synthase [Candidatus Krumholzibacteriales bacterium]